MIDKMIADLIKREGGYINHPDDKGGATKYGITLTTLGLWRKSPVSVQDVKDLSIEEATEIYRKKYLKDPRIDEIKDSKLQIMVFDFAVNSGSGNAIKCLQDAVGTTPDGVLGDITLKAVNAYTSGYNTHPQVLRKAYLGKRLSFLGRLITNKPAQATFAHGWMNRMNEILMECV